MDRLNWILVIVAAMIHVPQSWAQTRCEPEINRLLKSWHLYQNPMMTDRTTSLGYRQVGHTELNYKTLERFTFDTKQQAEKENSKIFNEWPKSETPQLYGQRVSIKEFSGHGISIQYEGLHLSNSNLLGAYSFKYSTMTLVLNPDCKIEQIFFPDLKLTLNPLQCRDLQKLSSAKQHTPSTEEVVSSIDPQHEYHLTYSPFVLKTIKDQCQEKSTVYTLLQGVSHSEVNRSIASEPNSKP